MRYSFLIKITLKFELIHFKLFLEKASIDHDFHVCFVLKSHSLEMHLDVTVYIPILQVGSMGAEGYCVNIPWSRGGVGDKDYIFAFEQVVLPIGILYLSMKKLCKIKPY